MTGTGGVRRRTPGRAVRALVCVAVRVLPRGDHRQRYRSEFLAELHGLPPAHRARHVVGLIGSAPRLSRAVREGRAATWERLYLSVPRRPLLCALRVGHRWGTVTADDSTEYQGCLRCGCSAPSRGSDGQALTWAGGTGPYGSSGNAV